MTTESGSPPHRSSPRPEEVALVLMRRARASARGAIGADVVLVVLFLLAIDPSNPVYSLTVLAAGGFVLGLVLLAFLLPVLTLVWVGWLQSAAARGDWTRVRRNLFPVLCLGYASWIVPGFYLHETLRLLDSPAWREPIAPAPSSAT